MDGSGVVTVIEAVLADELVVAPPELFPRGWGAAPTLDAGLTTRELQVLRLIAHGRSNGEITVELGLSINSVMSYVRSCYRKIGVSSRSRAVLWCATRGLLADVGCRPATRTDGKRGGLWVTSGERVHERARPTTPWLGGASGTGS
jgi:DNA-binding CsgD family transcriptional regulator